jgi:hypothetical protein
MRMTKVFVRHRRHVGRGAGRPRYVVVAVQGSDLRLKRAFLRRAELEKIAQETGAEIIYLPRGEHADEGGAERGSGRRGRRRKADVQTA